MCLASCADTLNEVAWRPLSLYSSYPLLSRLIIQTIMICTLNYKCVSFSLDLETIPPPPPPTPTHHHLSITLILTHVNSTHTHTHTHTHSLSLSLSHTHTHTHSQYEAIPESLKNMLLVMSTQGIFDITMNTSQSDSSIALSKVS